jgi:hypothetical protein
MSAAILESRLFNELKTAIDRGLASGELMTSAQIEQQTTLFRDRFGPAVLRGLALLWQIYSRRCALQIHFRQCGHRCCGGRAMSSRMA